MSKITDTVARLARPIAEGLSLSLWDVEFLREGSRRVLRILIDHPGGVSLNHCEAMSRALDPVLDEADPIDQSYVLQVSSAGLERTLKTEAHFARFMGQPVEVRLYTPRDGAKTFGGLLTGYDGQAVTIDSNTFPMSEVACVKTVFCEKSVSPATQKR